MPLQYYTLSGYSPARWRAENIKTSEFYPERWDKTPYLFLSTEVLARNIKTPNITATKSAAPPSSAAQALPRSRLPCRAAHQISPDDTAVPLGDHWEPRVADVRRAHRVLKQKAVRTEYSLRVATPRFRHKASDIAAPPAVLQPGRR